jgi:hypothetical protein
MFLQIAAIVLATVGIFLMAYDNGFKGFTLVGVVLAAIASVVAALYKVRIFSFGVNTDLIY